MNDNNRDSNWGRHGNPNRPEWYAIRDSKHLSKDFSLDSKDPWAKRIFSSSGPKISLFHLYLIIVGFLMVTAFVPSLRDYVYSGIEFTEAWYRGVDNLLDAFHVPQVPVK